jgi:preprotein translocase subunit SecB
LIIDPIDFATMFTQRVAEEQTRAQVNVVPN